MNSNSERTVDMFGISGFLYSDRVKYLYGENASNASRFNRSSRWEEDRPGKLCDYILKINDCEVGVGENAGASSREHHDDTRTKFVDVLKVTKSQYLYIKEEIDRRKSANANSVHATELVSKIIIPFFVAVNGSIHFYLLKQLRGELTFFYRWHEERLPVNGDKSSVTASLCRGFLIQYYLAEEVYEVREKALRQVQLPSFRRPFVDLNERPVPVLRTPQKRSSKQ